MEAATTEKLSDERRKEIISQAQRELPALSKQSRKAIRNLRRIANGRHSAAR